MNQEITDYIAKRYPRWLEFSSFHCDHAKIADESCDVLNEVIVDLLKKDEDRLLRMVQTSSKCGRYKELDIYVLRMIKLNIFSPTSPYQSRYRPIPVADVKFSRLKIADEAVEDFDRSEVILHEMNLVRKSMDDLNISNKARVIFEFKFFHGNSFSEWTGTESKKELYDVYHKVSLMIKDRLNGNTLL